MGNTLLGNKAVRGKSYFVKKAYKENTHQDYTPSELLRMGKDNMAETSIAF